MHLEEMMEAAFGRNVIAFVRKVGNWDRLSEVLHNFQQEHQCMVDVTWKKKVWQIDVSQILYIQSADNYSRVVFYLQGELVQALQSYTMKEWERILVENMFLMFAKILKYKQFVWRAVVSIAVEMLFLPIKNLKRNQTGATVWEICVFRK